MSLVLVLRLALSIRIVGIIDVESAHEYETLQHIGGAHTHLEHRQCLVIMLLKEGLRYGVYSSIVMIALYLAVQKVLYYFMTHVFLYLHPKSGIQIVPILIMILVNLAICAAAVVISGQSVLKEQVVDVIRE